MLYAICFIGAQGEDIEKVHVFWSSVPARGDAVTLTDAIVYRVVDVHYALGERSRYINDVHTQVCITITLRRESPADKPFAYDPRAILRTALVEHLAEGDAPVADRPDGAPVLASEMITMLDANDPAALDFLGAVTSSAVRACKLRARAAAEPAPEPVEAERAIWYWRWSTSKAAWLLMPPNRVEVARLYRHDLCTTTLWSLALRTRVQADGGRAWALHGASTTDRDALARRACEAICVPTVLPIGAEL